MARARWERAVGRREPRWRRGGARGAADPMQCPRTREARGSRRAHPVTVEPQGQGNLCLDRSRRRRPVDAVASGTPSVLRQLPFPVFLSVLVSVSVLHSSSVGSQGRGTRTDPKAQTPTVGPRGARPGEPGRGAERAEHS